MGKWSDVGSDRLPGLGVGSAYTILWRPVGLQWRAKCWRVGDVSALLEHDEQCLPESTRLSNKFHSQCSRGKFLSCWRDGSKLKSTCLTNIPKQAEKIFSLWDSVPDINPEEGSDITWPVDGHLELKNVTFFYQMRPDHLVLKEFNLDIPAGKTIALGVSSIVVKPKPFDDEHFTNHHFTSFRI